MDAVPKIPAQAGIMVVPKPHHKEQPVAARPGTGPPAASPNSHV